MSQVSDHEQTFRNALVVGSSGGLGAALVSRLRASAASERITVWSRRAPETAGPSGEPQFVGDRWDDVDITQEASIAAAASRLGDVDLVILATGVLHGRGVPPAVPELKPEKTWRALDASAMARSFAVNAIGPALVAKHVLPLFPRDRRAVFAALSARVGSISDNRLGGWYSYRASKAALNQLIRTLSIELAARRPLAVCVGLHPGTVATPLSRPFQANVAADRLFTPDEAAHRLLAVIRRLNVADTGKILDHAGLEVPP